MPTSTSTKQAAVVATRRPRRPPIPTPPPTGEPPLPNDIHQLNLLASEIEERQNQGVQGSAIGGNADSAESSPSAAHELYSTRQDHGLISRQRQRLVDDLPAPSDGVAWLRPYWLGVGLFLVLFPFWVLDTLKDPVFGRLVDGNLEFHQPPAKLFSVVLTLLLVCFLEYLSNAEAAAKAASAVAAAAAAAASRPAYGKSSRDDDDILDPGGTWSRMEIRTVGSRGQGRAAFVGSGGAGAEGSDDATSRVSGSIFVSIGVPYCIGFGIMAYLLQFNPAVAHMAPAAPIVDEAIPYMLDSSSVALQSFSSSSAGSSQLASPSSSRNRVMWHVLGYFYFAGIESFGSIAVATFWSYVNSSVNLEDAESYYGLIIGIAQLGAIAGSTMVSSYVWGNVTLLVMVCLVIILHVLVMTSYDRRFESTSSSTSHEPSHGPGERGLGYATSSGLGPHSRVRRRERPQFMNDARPQPEPLAVAPPTLWSGLYLVLKYNYVLLILGASCLYEVSLTCLNYQMTLLGWSRFQHTEHESGMNFTRFMGHYGQMVNISSLILSSAIFPFLLRRYGLRLTLRLFPSLLLLANLLAFGILPGNLSVLFVSMAVLKALTYSIHDPAKEILYLPTSNSIKFKSKFWIDVVGARFAKAVGSSINTISGSVDRSIRVASAPSLLTSMALWWVCYQVGSRFDELIANNAVVGLEEEDTSRYTSVSSDERRMEMEEDSEEFETDDALFEDPTTPTTALSSLELTSIRRSLQ